MKHTRREPTLRILKLHAALAGGAYADIHSLAGTLGVSAKTVKRDIQAMRDAFDLPLAYCPHRRAYHYARPVHNFPGAGTAPTTAQILAVIAARNALAPFQGTPFHQALCEIFRPITESLSPRQQSSLARLESTISFRPFAPEETDPSVFATAHEAVLEERALEFHHRKPGEPDSEPRTLHPYNLTYADNRWYLVGYDPERGDLRKFALYRIRDPQKTQSRFNRPEGFNAAKYLEHGFGVMNGDEDHVVEIEFDAWATDQLRGRRWHSSQTFETLPNGRSRLTLRLGCLEEVERWALSWGDHANILGPEALVRRMAVATRNLAARYAARS